MSRCRFLFYFLTLTCLWSSPLTCVTAVFKATSKEVKPYLLPEKHPLKPTLDAIFKGKHVLKNEQSFAEAGFITIHVQPMSHIIVASHPLLPGYLLKLYLDNEKRMKDGIPGWKWFVKRCHGVKNVQNLIKRKKLHHFVAPLKWIYPIPELKDKTAQPAILVVTDMELVSHEMSYQAWANATKEQVNELFCILNHGFASTYLPGNLPYTKHGKFACIDTEHPKRVLKLKSVKKYLSPDMQAYWETLTRSRKR
ncbi:MAG: hypothetical protein H0X51_01665 [Parachlamydiaceae bacterium]|nr:hypothetical protein [Parachlamydiaceae bacterium]